MVKEKVAEKKSSRNKDLTKRIIVGAVAIFVAFILIEQLSLSSSNPIRQNIALSLIQNSNETVKFSGDVFTVQLGSPISNTLSDFNELVVNSTGGYSLPMILTQLTATSNGIPISVETYSNQTNANLLKPDFYSFGRDINIFSATTTHSPYINSLKAQYYSGSLNISNGLFNNSLTGEIVSDSSYNTQLNSPIQIISNVVSPYYLDINNQSLSSGNSISSQYFTLNLFTPTGQQAILNLNISSFQFSGLFISNNQYLEGNVTYDHYMSIDDFTTLSLSFICYGVNVKVPYDYVKQVQITSSIVPFSSFTATSLREYVTNSQGETKSLQGTLNLSTPDILTLSESGHYLNESSNLTISYFVQANDAMVYDNGNFLYNATEFKYNPEFRNWMSLTAGALIGIGLTEFSGISRHFN